MNAKERALLASTGFDSFEQLVETVRDKVVNTLHYPGGELRPDVIRVQAVEQAWSFCFNAIHDVIGGSAAVNRWELANPGRVLKDGAKNYGHSLAECLKWHWNQR